MQSLLELFRKLNEQQRKIFVIAGGGFLFVLSLFITISVLNSNIYNEQTRELALLDRGDVSKVIKAFEKDKIDITTEDKNGKILVSVKDSDFKKAHLKISTLDVDSSKLLGWKLFEQNKLGKSSFENNVNYIRALEEELQIAINVIDGVISSKIKIVLPKDTLFINQLSDPTVSVILELENGKTLNSKQVEGIKKFIANSVEKLKLSNVEIISSTGISLEVNEDTGNYSLAQEQIRYRSNIEEQLKKKIIKTLEPVVGGVDNITAEITIDFDFNKKSSYEEIYDPNSVIRSEKNKNLKSNTSKEETIKSGVPGVVSNVAKDPSKQTDGKNLIQDKKEAEGVTNYEISKKVVETTRKKYGEITKIGASITFNTNAFKPEELEKINIKINNLVKSAINYSADRGDTVSVEGFAFFKYEKEVTTKEQINDVLGLLGGFFDNYSSVFKMLFVLFLLWVFYKKFILYVSDIKLMDEETKHESGEMVKLRKAKLDSERKRLLEEQFVEDQGRRDEERRKLERRIKDQINSISELTEEEEIKYSEIIKVLREQVKGKEEEMANLFENLLEINE